MSGKELKEVTYSNVKSFFEAVHRTKEFLSIIGVAVLIIKFVDMNVVKPEADFRKELRANMLTTQKHITEDSIEQRQVYAKLHTIDGMLTTLYRHDHLRGDEFYEEQTKEVDKFLN